MNAHKSPILFRDNVGSKADREENGYEADQPQRNLFQIKTVSNCNCDCDWAFLLEENKESNLLYPIATQESQKRPMGTKAKAFR